MSSEAGFDFGPGRPHLSPALAAALSLWCNGECSRERSEKRESQVSPQTWE